MSTVGRVFKMPWVASIRTSRSFAFAGIWILLALHIGKALPFHRVWQQIVTTALVLALVLVWKMVANTIWLARDARALRLPGIERDADWSLAGFVLASVVLPALIIGTMFGSTFVWLVSLTLVATGTMAFCTLPMVLVLPIFLVAIVVFLLVGWLPPMPGSPGYLAWAVPTLIVLMVASMQRWAMLRRAITLDMTPWLRPTAAGGRLVQVRRLRGDAHATGKFSRWTRKPVYARLARVGPEFPVRSIRIALGPYLKPLYISGDRGVLLKWLALFFVLTLAPAGLAMLAQLYTDNATIVRWTPGVLLWAGIVMTAPATALARQLDARWSDRHGELSLLALLPHLVARPHARLVALQACMARRLLEKSCFAISCALAFAALQLPSICYVYLALTTVCGMLHDTAVTAFMLGGEPLGGVRVHLFGWSALIPIVTMMSYGTGSTHGHLNMFGLNALVCSGVWLAWCVGFGASAFQGWRAMQRRPHPFLPPPFK